MSSPARGSSAVPVDRLEQLNDIEKEIVEALKNCGASLQELSKDNVTKKNAEQTSTAYIKSLQKIESDLLKQINYLSQVATGNPHEGSCYAGQKESMMAFHRCAHVGSRLKEMENRQDKPKAESNPTRPPQSSLFHM